MASSGTRRLDGRLPIVATFFAVVLMVAAICAAFGPALGGGFLNWDDDRNFVENESFRGLGIEQLRWAATTYHLGVWQPLAWVLFGLQWTIGGLDPRTYHAVSLLLHCLNAIVFFFLCERLLQFGEGNPKPSPWGVRVAAAAAAILFAVHPLRTETVAWISCQPYLPAVLFCQLAMLAYLRRFESVPVKKGGRWLAIASLCYVAAVGFKAAAIMLPAVLVIVDYLLVRRRGAWPILEKLPLAGVAVLVAIAAARAKDFNESRAPLREFEPSARVAQAAYGVGFYLSKTIAPARLIPYARLPDDLRLGRWPYGADALGVVIVTAGLALVRRRWPAAPAAWLAYLLILLPNLGLVQISQQLVTDRYSYLAMLPLMALLAGGVARFWDSLGSGARLARAGVILVIAAAATPHGLQSRRQCSVWHDSERLWRATLAVDADCAVAECNLGAALLAKERYAEASAHISRAIDLSPDFSFAYVNLGVIFCKAGRYEDCVRACREALSRPPGLPEADAARAHALLGEAYAGLGRYDLAWKHTRVAQRLGFKPAQRMIEYLKKTSKEPLEK